MAIKRSEFLRLSSWAFVSTLIPIQQVKALSFITDLKSDVEDNYDLLLNKGAQAKEHFYKKEYKKAEALYLECIKLAPGDIRFYDGLQNVYGVQGFWFQCVELYKNALKINSKKAYFYDRAARSLMRLELGYSEIADKYKYEIKSKSLLEDSKVLYNEGLKINSKAKYLKIGLEKVERKIESNALQINYATNREERAKRLERRRKHKRRYQNFDNKKLLSTLESIKNKKRTPLYFENELKTRSKNILKEDKILYTALANNYKKEKKNKEALEYASRVYEIDPKNTKIVQLIKKLHLKEKNYSALLEFQKRHNEREQTVYSKLGLMNALNLQFLNATKSTSLLNESIDLGEELYKNWDLLISLKIKVVTKLIQTYCLRGDVDNAKQILDNLIKNDKVHSDNLINVIVHSYASVFVKSNNLEEAKGILLLGIGKEYDLSKELDHVKEFISKKSQNTFTSDLMLNYLLYDVYKREGDTENATNILNYIKDNDPTNKFVLKRL